MEELKYTYQCGQTNMRPSEGALAVDLIKTYIEKTREEHSRKHRCNQKNESYEDILYGI